MVYVNRVYPWVMLENINSILFSINVETWEIRNEITHKIVKGSFNKYSGKLFYFGDNCFVTLKKLIAMQFLPNPNNYKFVIFKDGDVNNYSLDNLAWSDRQGRQKRKN